MKANSRTLSQAKGILKDHSVDEVYVNRDGHFFLSLNPALLSVNQKKSDILLITAADVADLEEDEEPEAPVADQTPAADAGAQGEVVEGTEETAAGSFEPAAEVSEENAGVPQVSEPAAAEEPAAPAADLPQLFEVEKTVITAGNPNSPEERGELVAKPASAAKAAKAPRSPKAKGK